MYYDDDGTMGGDDESMEAMNARMEQESVALAARWEASDVDAKLRKLGIYVEHVSQVPVPHPSGVQLTMAVMAKVNRAAFTTRVLDPEKAAMDQQFAALATHAKDDEFLDQREQIKRNIAEGRDPFDNGEVDDSLEGG